MPSVTHAMQKSNAQYRQVTERRGGGGKTEAFTAISHRKSDFFLTHNDPMYYLFVKTQRLYRGMLFLPLSGTHCFLLFKTTKEKENKAVWLISFTFYFG